jgi:glycosyltransferase involved in cell wall biosynthesis
MIKRKILEISHVRTPGPAQDLYRFLSKTYENVTFVAHPFKTSAEVLGSTGTRIYQSRNGIQINPAIQKSFSGPELFFWIRDLWQSLAIGLKTPGKYDLIICLNCLNALSGIILKFFAKTDYLIYYTVDITQNRFALPLLNIIYIYIDKFAYKYADEVWNIGPGIKNLRIKLKYKLNSKKEKNIPIGIFPADFKIPPIRRDKYKIIYLGTISYIMGLQLAITAMPMLLKKYPKLKLEIIGTGEYKITLMNLVSKLNLNRQVIFKIINEKKRVIPELFSASIGIAPYLDIADSFKKNCEPAKVKEYFAAGLPVIITKVPLITNVIHQQNLGIAINYSVTDYAKAVGKMLTEQKMFNRFRKNIRFFMKNYDWNNIYHHALWTFNNKNN